MANPELLVDITINPASLQKLQASLNRLGQQIGQQFAASVNQGARGFTGLQNASEKAAKSINTQMTRGADAVQRVGQSAQQSRADFVSLAIGLEVVGRSLTQFISAPLGRFLKQSVLEASNLNEIINQTKIIFGESSDAVIQWAEDLDTAFGLTTTEALTANNNFTLLFNEIGVGLEDSSNLAQLLVERIGDLASFRDIPVEDVLRRIQSGLVGQTESVRKLGVVLDEAVIKEKAREQGIIDGSEALNTQQKFLVRAQQILLQTSEAQGDAARTAETFAGQLRQLRTNSADLRESIGQVLLPTLTSLFTILNTVLVPLTGLARGFQELPGFVKTLATVFLGLVVALGPVVTLFGRLTVLQNLRGLLGASKNVAALAKKLQGLGAAGRGAATSLTLVGRALPVIGLGITALAVGQAIFSALRSKAEDLQDVLDEINEDLIITTEQLQRLFNVGRGGRVELDISELVDAALAEQRLTEETIAARDALELEARTFGDTSREAFDLKNRLEELNDIRTSIAEGEFTEQQEEAIKRFQEAVDLNAFGEAKRTLAALNKEVGDNANASKNATDFQAELNRILEEGKQRYIEAQRAALDNNKELQILAELAKGAKDSYKDFLDVLDEAVSTQEKIESANDKVASAQERVVDANFRLEEAERTLNELRREGAVDAEEVADAEEDLARSRERVADARRRIIGAENDVTDARVRLIEATNELNEALKPADAESIAEAQDKITLAEIALARARRENNTILEKNAGLSKTQINLAGKTTDEIRTQLSNVRASLTAQRDLSQVTEEGVSVAKTEEELREEAILAEIEERDRIRDLNDAKEALTELTIKGTEADQDVIDARIDVRDATLGIEDAENDLADARRGLQRSITDVAKAEESLRKARQGDPEFINKVEKAERAVEKARQDQKKAVDDVAEAERDRKLTLNEINLELAEQSGNEEKINGLIRDRIELNRDLLASRPDLARQFAEQIVSTFPIEVSSDFINQLAEELLTNPGSDLRAILRSLGVTGFKAGGLVVSRNPLGKLVRAGERGNPEAILPLRQPNRVADILKQSMPYAHPQVKSMLSNAISGSVGTNSVEFVSSKPNKTDQRIDRLISLLENSHVEVHAPINVHSSNDKHAARTVAREIQRRLDRI